MLYNLAVVKPAKGTPGIKICSMEYHGFSIDDAIDRCLSLVGTEFIVMDNESYHQNVSLWALDQVDQGVIEHV